MREQIFAALTAHTAWKQRLAQAIDAGIIDPPPSVIAEDNLCVFGKWLYGEEIPVHVKQSSEYEEVRQIHCSDCNVSNGRRKRKSKTHAGRWQ